MGLLQRGTAWLSAATETAGKATVTYARPGGDTVTLLNAVPTAVLEQAIQPTPGARARVDAASRDYLIDPAEFTAFVEPRPRDVITETLGGNAAAFVVTEIPGKACWEWADPDRLRMKVHTRPR